MEVRDTRRYISLEVLGTEKYISVKVFDTGRYLVQFSARVGTCVGARRAALRGAFSSHPLPTIFSRLQFVVDGGFVCWKPSSVCSQTFTAAAAG